MQPGGGQIITARKEIHMNMIKKIFRTIKNILFPRVYMPWEQPGITDLSSAELQELIALIDAHLAELDENGEIE